MKRIAIGLAVVAVVAVIALVSRDRLADGAMVGAGTEASETTAARGDDGGAGAIRNVGAAGAAGEAADVNARGVSGAADSASGASVSGGDVGAARDAGWGVEGGASGVEEDEAGGDGADGGAAAAAPAEADEPGPGSSRASGSESGGADQEPAPETVLERAAEAYEGVESLRADFDQVVENTLLGTTATSRGAIHQRRPDRFLMEFSEPAGDVIVGDGEHFWIYYPSIDERQVIRTPMRAGGAGGVDLQAQFLGDPNERFDATMEEPEAVDGRRAYVLLLEPTRSLGYERLRVWVDAEDHLVRRFEIHEPNGVIRRIELDGLEINPALDESLFEFTPPADARIVDQG